MKILYKLASYCLIIIGIGHLCGHFFLAPDSSQTSLMMQSMRDYKINMLGIHSLLDFHEGFSMLMGFMILGFGLQTLFTSEYTFTNPKGNRNFILVILVSIAVFVVSLKYFFIVPQIFSFLASLFFVLSFILQIKKANRF